MIWFNGFPFLDNKEDHVFNVPVSHAMTSNPLSLPASDFPVREAEHLLNDNRFQGFPIVEDRTSKILLGYIGRTELRFAIDRARREGLLSPNAKCVFTKQAAEEAVAQRAEQPAPVTFDNIETSTGAPIIDFSRYVDHTPLSVHPRLPLETVMELFKKMGPRVILVEHRGRLNGLVTVKDCLKYQFKVEAEEHALAATNPSWFGPSGSNNHVDGPGKLEERIWDFLQWIGGKVGLASSRSVRLESRPRRPLGRTESSSRILDGTEEDGARIELEERDRR
jgi:Predicted transcriptional regulator, contains C-terminal CBS domains